MHALMPDRVMVCMSANALAPCVIRTGANLASALRAAWYAVYVETPPEHPARIQPDVSHALRANRSLARELGGTVVRVSASSAADGLVAFAQREGVSHIVMGQTARRWWERIRYG